MGEASGSLEVVVIPFFEVGHRVLREEFRGDALAGDFPRRRLCSVLAELKKAGIRRLGPGAADAHETIGLVLLEQNARATKRYVVPPQALYERLDRSPASGCSLVRLDLKVRS